MTPHASRFCTFTVLAFAGALGCSREKSGPATSGSVAESTLAPSATAAKTAAGPPPACTLGAEKVWPGGGNALAGILLTELDAGRVGAGVILGGRPQVLVFDAQGEAQAVAVRMKKALTDAPQGSSARREIRRVTPALASGGEVMAFVDYREIAEGRRRVACGPSDANEDLLSFDGKPLLVVDEDAPKKPAEARPEPSAGPPKAIMPPSAAKPAPSSSVPHAAPSGASPAAPMHPPALRGAEATRMKDAIKMRLAAAAASGAPRAPAPSKAAAPPPSATPPGPSKPKGEKVRELRDCRTIVDRGGAHAWATGSELVGQPLEDGSTDYSMVFFVQQEHGRGRVDLFPAVLGKAPTKLPIFDAPTAIDVGASAFAIAARYKSAAVAFLLDATKRPKGPPRFYTGYSPTPPRWGSLGPEYALLVVHDAAGRHVARAGRFEAGAAALPATLTDLALGAADVPSEAPTLLGVDKNRFLAFIAGDAAHRFVLLPVDANLATAGSELQIDAGVVDAQAFAIPGGFVAVYLRSAGPGKTDLVSRVARCG